MSTCLVGLAVQVPNNQTNRDESLPLAYLFNGHAGEHEVDAIWRRVQGSLSQEIQPVDFHEVGETIQTVREEITRRQDDRSTAHRPLFLFVFDLTRFRELAKAEEDFGLGGFGEKPKPASAGKLFGEILREGSAVGVHVVIWCNTYNNVDRMLGRQLLKEFELRVAFQMSTGDSSSLIDNPAAGRLGPNRALLYLDDQGTTEKFRPYGRPSDEWLEWVKEQFTRSESTNATDNHKHLEALDDINDLTIH